MKQLLNPHILLLTGPKHAGKTSTGRVLASLWGGDFVDLDELIEKQTGKSPRTLYQEAPEHFRKAEAETLETLLQTLVKATNNGSKYIIAAGGGIIDNKEALRLLKTSEIIIVYLEVSAETAWARIYADKEAGGTLPPFLNTSNPQETHKRLHLRRAAAYRRLAHITIQAEAKEPAHISREVVSRLAQPTCAQ